MSKSGSVVTVSAEKAKVMAERTIKSIDGARDRLIKEFVKEETARRNRSWFRRLFRMRPVTEEEVFQDDYGQSQIAGYRSQIWLIENIHYAQQEDLAYRVLKAARYSETVTLTVEDLDSLT